MRKLSLNDVTIEIHTHPLPSRSSPSRQDEREAVVVPASGKQRRELGNAAVGQAWTVWAPTGSASRTIKFMPPDSTTEANRTNLIDSYRAAILGAEWQEMTSVLLPLPKQAGLTCDDGNLVGALVTNIVESCRRLKYLRHVRLLASDEQEAACFSHYLVDEHGRQS